ncbi:GGDEF domain-containing protein [Marinomonas epiphytica]
MASYIRTRLRGLGRVPFVILLTLSATTLACTLDFLLIYGFTWYHPFKEDLWLIISLAIIITFIVTPVLSWYLVGLFLKVDQLELKMSYMAMSDDLTGTYNRSYFYQEGAKILSEDSITDISGISSFALLVIDLDYFKSINDQYGHECGDKVLVEFGRILLDKVQRPNMVGRLGGEEFAVLMPNARHIEAEELASEIIHSARETQITYKDQKVTFTVSIGISLDVKSPHTTLDNAFREADMAMYEAKEKGRDNFVVYGVTGHPNVHQLF